LTEVRRRDIHVSGDLSNPTREQIRVRRADRLRDPEEKEEKAEEDVEEEDVGEEEEKKAGEGEDVEEEEKAEEGRRM
jgi:hypothetical protein